jgi:DDE domain
VKVAGQWRYVYRAIDQFGQVIDVFVSARRDEKTAGRFFERAIGDQTHSCRGCHRSGAGVPGRAGGPPTGGVAPHRAIREQPGRGRSRQLKARLRPMRGLKQDRSARVIIAGHAFIQNVRRGHYELAVQEPPTGDWRSRSTSRSWRSDPKRTRRPHSALGPTQRNSTISSLLWLPRRVVRRRQPFRGVSS